MEKEVRVSHGYHCPFCPDHKDEMFYESDLVGQPICEGCAVELDIFCENKKRRDDKLIDALESHTGLSWNECRKVLLEQKLASWKNLQAEQPEWWLKRMKKVCGWNREKSVAHLQEQVARIQGLLDDAKA